MTKTTIPIAEHFHSIQGEGTYAGYPMHFIRTAGCSVGVPQPSVHSDFSKFVILKTGARAWRCHTYDHRSFWCDTDFNRHEFIEIRQLIAETWEDHICVTGGEPFIHRETCLPELLSAAWSARKKLHFETSGTIDWKPLQSWITVSPKEGVLDSMIQTADEIKLLIDPEFNIRNIPDSILAHDNVYIQPINDENTVRLENVKLCMEVLRTRPDWKLSVQLHKFLGMR